MNVEPRGTATPAMQNIAIVTRGGKKTGEDAREKDLVWVIRPASPKQLIRPEMQKKYFQEAAETFSQLGGDKGIKLPVKKNTGDQGTTRTLIEE